jgi:hypothetical protein
MRFWLNQIDGSCSQIVVSSDSTFESLIEEYNLSSARLICQGSQIDSTNFLELLCEDINVYVTGDLDGGKKKKKKKVYTTKKKNKHIHKRVKLSIYTLYGVDGIYPFTQEKETLPNNERLAHHADLELSWPNIGIGITADFATPPSRWMLKPSKRTNKS